MDTEAAVVAHEHQAGAEAALRERLPTESQLAYYSQSPGGSTGTIPLPAPQGWTQADLEHASAVG